VSRASGASWTAGTPAPYTPLGCAIPRWIDALREPSATEEDPAVSEPRQQFSASLAKDVVYETGLRSFIEYHDLN
jgi:hypothetical protein